MTIIVAKDGIMAADSIEIAGSLVFPCVMPKIERHHGMLIGAAGATADCHLVMEWFARHGRTIDSPECTDLPFLYTDGISRVDILVMRPNGGLWRNGVGVKSFYPELSAAAIGAETATIVAEAALRLGRTAAQAVQLCIEMCTKIGGPVQVEHVRQDFHE